jgi:hypothetical protein
MKTANGKSERKTDKNILGKRKKGRKAKLIRKKEVIN